MKKLITNLVLALSMFFTGINFSNGALISDAGTASTTEDSICIGGSTTLLLTGYTGTIQWQSFDGANWINEVNVGSTTDNYTITPVSTTDYRAVVTDAGFPPDTSNVITITVGVSAPTTTGDTRCGYGQVTLTAAGGGSTFKWYDLPTGGIPLYTGPSFTTNVAATTTFYAASASNGGGAATTAMPPEDAPFNFNTRGYWFIAPSDFTITGLYVPTPINGSTQNIAVLKFDNNIPPQPFPALTNAFTTAFVTQNDPTPGVIAVNIPIFAGEVIGILATRGINVNSYAIGPYVTTIDGQNVTISRMGMQFELSNTLPMDIWEEPNGSISRCEISYEVGCESSRTPAIATVNAAPVISINANPPALCEGQSSVITVSSSNANYTYTWSPGTGLNTTTGATVTATPLVPVTYTVVAVDGACGEIDSVFMSVGPASVAGTASISTDTICLGTDAYLQLAGNTGTIQWQSFDGTNWINETGIGNNTTNYAVSPTTFTQYQAVVTSGGCDADTTITLSLAVLSIVDPITVNDTICEPGVVDLTASGPGLLSWYTAPSGGTSIATGPSYSPNITATTTYYVQASAGGTYLVGPADPGFGSQANAAGNDYGLQFDVNQQATIEKVYMSPSSSGTVTINLRDTQNGPILNTVTAPVTAFSGLVPISLGFTVNPGTYRLELATGSANCYYNTNNSTFPYLTTGSPISITGNIDPAFNTFGSYYYFYNWEVNQGCSSNRIPVTGVVTGTVPVISQAGNILTSSAAANNQWNLNGTPIPGATGVTYDMSLTGPGTYTVTVTENGCTITSLPVIFVGLNELAAAGISVYPNPVNDFISIEMNTISDNKSISVYNAIGDLILEKNITQRITKLDFIYPGGIYFMEIKTNTDSYVTKIVKL